MKLPLVLLQCYRLDIKHTSLCPLEKLASVKELPVSLIFWQKNKCYIFQVSFPFQNRTEFSIC